MYCGNDVNKKETSQREWRLLGDVLRHEYHIFFLCFPKVYSSLIERLAHTVRCAPPHDWLPVRRAADMYRKFAVDEILLLQRREGKKSVCFALL